MKQRALKVCSSAALALALCLSVMSPPVFGQDSNGKKLIGTWNVTVTRAQAPPGQPLSFPVLYSFLSGGIMLETGSTSPFRSPGHGVWDRTGPGSYTAELMFFRFGPDGQYLGPQHVTLNVTLASGGDEFTATIAFDVIDTAGNVVASGAATAAGQRMALSAQ
jgi:hypothetical protein